jgi:hypothetical protein
MGIEQCPDVCSVVEVVHVDHPVTVDAGQRRPERSGTRRDHQIVERLAVFAARGELGHPNRPRGQIDRGDERAGPHVDLLTFAKFRRLAGNQVIAVTDGAADPIRDAARRERGIGPALEGQDFTLCRRLATAHL